MAIYTHWRGFDLRPRQLKLARALAREKVTSADDVPIVVNSPGYFAFGSQRVPPDYFTNPASMVAYQEAGYLKHLQTVNDDYVPYFMPWFGTGVLASAFGCQIVIQPGQGNDPAVAGPCIASPRDAARLTMPDPYKDGWMPRVLDAIDYARAHSDLPPGLTDMQGPLDTLGLMCGQAQLYQWMYSEPQMVHDLFDLVTAAFIEWVKVQKKHIGEPLDSSHGLQGVWAPTGLGVWESDDDAVLLDARLYREYVVPCVSRIFRAFGGGSVHFCGSGVQHIGNLRDIENLRVVNNSPMGNTESFARLRNGLGGKACIQIQDSAPLDIERYYTRLFAAIDNMDGLVLAPFVCDTVAMDDSGGYAPVDWDPLEAANRIVAVARACIRRRLAGEPLETTGPEASHRPVVAAPADGADRRVLTESQRTALQAIQTRMTTFDRSSIKPAVEAALAAGLAPLDIVTLGFAAGMVEVGRRYEAGEFYLPQLLMAGATMKDGMSVLEPLLAGATGRQRQGVVVLGTVEGDMHDIGKNLVKMLLEAAGFSVHDIGVNQKASSFVNKAREVNADIVAMSALLTTTMGKMVDVIAALRHAGMTERLRVMVGGAPISRQFADHIGADGYAPDAVKAVREAERLMHELAAARGAS